MDLLPHFSKTLLLGARREVLCAFEERFQKLKSLAPTRKIRIGSLCTGSGIADVALSVMLDIFGREVSVSKDDIELLFMCEADDAKARFLLDNIDPPALFDDARILKGRSVTRALCVWRHAWNRFG